VRAAYCCTLLSFAVCFTQPSLVASAVKSENNFRWNTTLLPRYAIRVNVQCGRVDQVLVGSSLGHQYSVYWVSMVGGSGGGCTLMAIGHAHCPFLEDTNSTGRRISYS